MSRFFLALVASVSGIAAFAADPAKPASTPPAVPAFDLTYLPGAGPSGFVALRPAALADLIPATADEVRQLMSYGLGLMGGQPNAAALPTAGELEQVVLKLDVRTTYDKFAQPGGRPHTFGLCCTGGTFRAAKKLDWLDRFAEWFPKGERAEYAGRTYYRIPMTFGEQEVTMAAFAPDDRTVSVDSDENVRALMTAVKEKKAVVTPPTGWADVSGDLIAAFVDLKAKTALAGLRESHETKLFRPFVRFEDAVESLVVGVRTGDATAIRATLTTRKGGTAGTKAVKELLAKAIAGTTAALKDDADEFTPLVKWAAAAVGGAKVETTGKTVSVKLTAPGDVRKMLESLTGPVD